MRVSWKTRNFVTVDSSVGHLLRAETMYTRFFMFFLPIWCVALEVFVVEFCVFGSLEDADDGNLKSRQPWCRFV